MNTESSTQAKDAKDGTEFEAYPVHSMAVLWSMSARKTTDAPLDGDAMARRACRTRRLAESWEILDKLAIEQLRNNHHEIDRTNR